MRSRLSHSLRIAMAQLNLTVGDIEGNTKKIIESVAAARDRGADLVVFPELAVTGYPPEDLLLKQGFVEANIEALDRIAATARGVTAVVGFVDVVKDIYNAAAVIHDGNIVGVQHKFFLPNYGVFDEDRYFQAGTKTQVYTINGVTFGVEVCEDAWYAGGPHTLQALMGGAHLIVDINSSPFHAGKWQYRERMLGTRATDNSCAIVYLNAVGGQDELVFDGHSLVVGPAGDVLFRCKPFEEQLAIVDVDLSPVEHQRLVDPRRRKAKLKGTGAVDVPEVILSPLEKPDRNGEVSASSEPPGDPEEVYRALVLGTRDYVNKNSFKEVVLGLSGGIDSAITACIACDALGPDRVRVLIMPSMYSSNETQSDAEVTARNLGIRFDYIAINEVFDAYNRSLAEVFKGTQAGVAEENLQARIRGNLLMALSNKLGALVLTTGNKSEMACGYSTLYGDMAGGFAVIKDVPKTLVYRLSRYRNSIKAVIPESVIVRPPSAELRPDQTDQDTLPPYEILDPILEAYVEEDRGPKEITAMGFDEETVRRVIRMVDRNEYKRRQAAPGVKITPKAFGRDRRLPITNLFRE
ncbi:MAG: NAD+ synthase [Armatimonadetes bacterium]|nr:NAD+ synthase [Armatimonadota bacterium]